MIKELYQFITSPKQYIYTNINNLPKHLAYSGIIIYALTQGLAFNLTASFNNLLFLSAIYLILNTIAMIVSVSFIDFFAQITNCKAKSKTLFFWMFTPYIFSALFVPAQLLISVWSGLLSLLITWILIATIVSLQLYIIKQIYNVSSIKGFMLYISPILIITSILFISLIIIGRTLINFISLII